MTKRPITDPLLSYLLTSNKDFQDKEENLLKNQKDVLWGLFAEYQNHARHHEVQRSTVTNIIIVASSALLGLSINSSSGIGSEDLPITILLIILGVFGAIFCLSHSIRYKIYTDRAKYFLDEVDGLIFKTGKSINETIETSEEKTWQNLGILSKFEMFRHPYFYWITFPLFIAGVGLTLTIIIIL